MSVYRDDEESVGSHDDSDVSAPPEDVDEEDLETTRLINLSQSQLPKLQKSLRQGGGLKAAFRVGEFKKGMTLVAGGTLDLTAFDISGLEEGDDLDGLKNEVNEAIAAAADDKRDMQLLVQPSWVKTDEDARCCRGRCPAPRCFCCRRRKRKWRRQRRIRDRITVCFVALQGCIFRCLFARKQKGKRHDVFISAQESDRDIAAWLRVFCINRSIKAYSEAPCAAGREHIRMLESAAEEDEAGLVAKSAKKKSRFTGVLAKVRKSRHSRKSKKSQAGKESSSGSSVEEEQTSGDGSVRKDGFALAIPPWLEVRREELKSSGLLLVVLNEDSFSHSVVLQECLWAWQSGVPIMPVCRHSDMLSWKTLRKQIRWMFAINLGMPGVGQGASRQKFLTTLRRAVVKGMRVARSGNARAGKLPKGMTTMLTKACHRTKKEAEDTRHLLDLQVPPPARDAADEAIPEEGMLQKRNTQAFWGPLDPLGSAGLGADLFRGQSMIRKGGTETADMRKVAADADDEPPEPGDEDVYEEGEELDDVDEEAAAEAAEEAAARRARLDPELEDRVYGIIALLAIQGESDLAIAKETTDALRVISSGERGAFSIHEFDGTRIFTFFVTSVCKRRAGEDIAKSEQSRKKTAIAAKLKLPWGAAKKEGGKTPDQPSELDKNINPEDQRDSLAEQFGGGGKGSDSSVGKKKKRVQSLLAFCFGFCGLGVEEEEAGGRSGTFTAPSGQQETMTPERLDVMIADNCLAALRNMACRSSTRKGHMLDKGVAQTATRALRIFNSLDGDNIRINIAALIRNLSTGTNHGPQVLVDAGLLDLVEEELMGENTDKEVKRHLLAAVQNVAMHAIAEGPNKLFKEGDTKKWMDICSAAVERAMREHELRVAQQAVTTLGNFALLHEKEIGYASESSGSDFLSPMKAWPKARKAADEPDDKARPEDKAENYDGKATTGKRNAAEKDEAKQEQDKESDKENAAEKDEEKQEQESEVSDDEDEEEADSDRGSTSSVEEEANKDAKELMMAMDELEERKNEKDAARLKHKEEDATHDIQDQAAGEAGPQEAAQAHRIAPGGDAKGSSQEAEKDVRPDDQQSITTDVAQELERSLAAAEEKVSTSVLERVLSLLREERRAKIRVEDIVAVMSALCNCAQDVDVERSIGALGGVELVLDAMAHTPTIEVRMQALHFLWNMTFSRTNQARFLAADGLAEVLRIISEQKQPAGARMQEQGCGIIRNLATGTKQQKRQIFDQGVVEALCQSIQAFPWDPGVARQAASALCLLCEGAHLVAEEACHKDGVEALTLTLSYTLEGSDPDLTDTVLHALERLLITPTALQRLCVCKGHLKILKTMEMSDATSTWICVCRALAAALVHLEPVEVLQDAYVEAEVKAAPSPRMRGKDKQKAQDTFKVKKYTNAAHQVRDQLLHADAIAKLCKAANYVDGDVHVLEAIAGVILNLTVDIFEVKEEKKSTKSEKNAQDVTGLRREAGLRIGLFLRLAEHFVGGSHKDEPAAGRFIALVFDLFHSLVLNDHSALSLHRHDIAEKSLDWMRTFEGNPAVQRAGCGFLRNFAASRLRILQAVVENDGVSHIMGLLSTYKDNMPVIQAALRALETLASSGECLLEAREQGLVPIVLQVMDTHPRAEGVLEASFAVLCCLAISPSLNEIMLSHGCVRRGITALSECHVLVRRRDQELIFAVRVVGMLRNMVQCDAHLTHKVAAEFRESNGYRTFFKLLWRLCLPAEGKDEEEEQQTAKSRTALREEQQQRVRIAEQALAFLSTVAGMQTDNDTDALARELLRAKGCDKLRKVLELNQSSAMIQHQGFRLITELVAQRRELKPLFAGIGTHVQIMEKKHRNTPVTDVAELLLEEVA